MTAVQEILTPKSSQELNHFKGTIDGKDFTATAFSISKTADRWTVSGTQVVVPGLVRHKIQLSFPTTLMKGVYKLEEERHQIRRTYTTDDLLDPIFIRGDTGLIDLTTIDPANDHVEGGLLNILTHDDGNPVSTITALFRVR